MRPLRVIGATGAALAGLKLAGDLAVPRYEYVSLDRTRPLGHLACVPGPGRIHYLDEGAGEVAVLLHGLGASTFSWRHNIAALAEGHRVIAVDLPGHGLSSRDVADLSLTAQAGYLASLLDFLGVERASLVAHSMGGSVAQRFAVAHPERVQRLVLIASTTDEFMLRAAPLSPLLAPFVPAFVTAVLHNHPARRRWLQRAVYDPVYLSPEVIAAYEAPGHIRGTTRAYQRLMRDRRRDIRIDPARIQAPALIIWGERDRVVSIGHGERLAKALPESRIVVVPRAGHLVQEEQAEAVNSLLLDFLPASRTPPRVASRRGVKSK